MLSLAVQTPRSAAVSMAKEILQALASAALVWMSQRRGAGGGNKLRLVCSAHFISLPDP